MHPEELMPEIIKKYNSMEEFKAGAASLASKVSGSLHYSDEQINIIRKTLLKPQVIEKKFNALVYENPRVLRIEKQIGPLTKKKESLSKTPYELKKLEGQVKKKEEDLKACEKKLGKDKSLWKTDKTHQTLTKDLEALTKSCDQKKKSVSDYEKLNKQVQDMTRACDKLRAELERQATLTLVHTDRSMVVVIGKKPVLTVPYNT